jgi:hypothetical protein
MIGVTEKGHITLKLKATTQAGHASTPSPQTSIGALSLAIATLENNPFPQHLEMVEFMMSFVGDEMPFMDRLRLANTWLFGGAVKRKMRANPITDANTRTTIAPTVLRAGSAENVLPACGGRTDKPAPYSQVRLFARLTNAFMTWWQTKHSKCCPHMVRHSKTNMPGNQPKFRTSSHLNSDCFHTWHVQLTPRHLSHPL